MGLISIINTIYPFADSHAGRFEDGNGVFTIYFIAVKFQGDEPGWYWLPEMGCPEGPFATSEMAHRDATTCVGPGDWGRA